MNEKELIEHIEQFFRWYRQVYDSELILEHPVTRVSTSEPSDLAVQKGRQGQAQTQTISRRAVQYRQTSPELQAFYEEIKDCQQCELHKTRKNFVFGYGNAQAEVMFVGEAPGREEDEQGLPFVGAAGKLLDKMFSSIGLSRDSVYIANVLKCRPPDNRDPRPDEIARCEPYLIKQIEMIKPKLIVALGRFAAQSLLRLEQPLGVMRDGDHRYQNIPVIVTYHPAALLRNPALKQKAWQDLKKIKRFLDARTGESGSPHPLHLPLPE
ncbi:uracil-DNA glycosylase [Caldithrix abyssi]